MCAVKVRNPAGRHVITRHGLSKRVDGNVQLQLCNSDRNSNPTTTTTPPMAGPTVFEDVAGEFALDGVGQLFEGKKFWVAQRVPSRVRLLDDIKANGGEVVLLEKRADYKIADHFRKDCPPGTISYEFVTKSIQDGRLRDPEDHPAGPPEGDARAPGDLHRPAKGSRTPYTPEEDGICYKWVRDCVAGGGSASGNEIYKQLEEKYRRHPWQSWRDRYLKQLRNRPPSAFNIPDNAPPSPPSDHPSEQPARATPVPKPANQATEKVTGQGTARDTKSAVPPNYTLEQLAASFSSEDWEELYANVDVINAIDGDDRSNYEKAWKKWAEAQDNQTAEQWQQYYEKVVRPQWMRDPESKRQQVKQNVDKKHEAQSHSQTADQQQQEDLHQDASTGATSTGAESNKISKEAPVAAGNERPQGEASKLPSENKMMSSSTAQYESPKYIKAMYQNVLKRARGDDTEEPQPGQQIPREQSPPHKRQRSLSPITRPTSTVPVQAGTSKQPVEIFSSDGSSSDEEDMQLNNQIMEDVKQPQHDRHVLAQGEVEEDIERAEPEDLVDIEQSPAPPEVLGERSEDELPSNTPTPRPPRHRTNNFDTQAILSSPSQDARISKLPHPVDFTQAMETQDEQRSSSLAPHLDSDNSTTQSLQEFRRSLNGEEISQLSYPALQPLPRAPSFSPTSSNSSDDSDDPDPPLAADELDDFFAAQNAVGLSDAFVARALKRTRCRPGLAEIVLDAWKDGKPLPWQRGIWSLEDDEAAESGDGVELAQLERKHTLDGWGGITERLRFLEGYRSR
ncbi:DNA-binding protein RAP1 [Parastagonospora nodorum]|nr:DNA-binding protein RAP1 [Parastagonospora nodorum]KAH4188021.1 DNA-binding protein RAP1 [Parastagonospora nodorum]KAH4260613.1 DNA-binding protein RAP1 [Parastagonospora nodorum]KAH4267046.1 DNA-binding protein RAP1 [Parastagonospora nodorum]KAH4961497.1 DNA-binding protein RAP1 [Parastagonospora nodorum]